MQKITLNLPKYRLIFNLNVVKRRKDRLAEPLIPSVEAVNKKYRKGSFLGRFFRHIFEHKKIGRALATNFALFSIATSFMPQISSSHAYSEASLAPVIENKIVLTTQKGIQYPANPVLITQRYSFFHGGIDLDGMTGDPIKPIKSGVVVSVKKSKFGYGNEVIVDHGNQLTTLYAHLSKIEVEEGKEVTMDTKLGEMGATGRAFGDHLHLEIRDHGRAINPLSVLP